MQIGRLVGAGVKVEETGQEKKSGPLSGKTFVFTGRLEKFTRPEAEKIVEDKGGRATSSVSGETDYAVAGQDPGSKYEEARQRRIRIIGEEEFRKMVRD